MKARRSAVRAVRRAAAELPLRRYAAASPRRSSTSRCRPTAWRRPGAWRSSCSSTIPAVRRRAAARRSPALLAWAKAHPGRFTYPAPPDFIGSTFLKHVLIELDRGPGDAAAAGRGGRFRGGNRLRSGGGSTRSGPISGARARAFPASGPALHQLLDDGEVDLSMAFNPAEASAAIAAGRLPESVRSFILDAGTIGNTHFVAIPFNAAHQAGAHGGRRLPAVARGPGAQAGSPRLGRRHGARPRRAERRRSGRASRRCRAASRRSRPTSWCRSGRSPIHPGWCAIEAEWLRRFSS